MIEMYRINFFARLDSDDGKNKRTIGLQGGGNGVRRLRQYNGRRWGMLVWLMADFGSLATV